MYGIQCVFSGAHGIDNDFTNAYWMLGPTTFVDSVFRYMIIELSIPKSIKKLFKMNDVKYHNANGKLTSYCDDMRMCVSYQLKFYCSVCRDFNFMII